jgi:hypothetical protein
MSLRSRASLSLAVLASLALAASLGAPSAGATPPEAKKGPRIAVEPGSFDFGQALQNKTLTKEFAVRNMGDADLVIEDVKTSCGCTAALLSSKVVKPGGQTPLRVALETRSALGRVERRVVIRSNDSQQTAFSVTVSVTVVAGKP